MVRQIFVWLLLIIFQCSIVFPQRIINLNADKELIPAPRAGGIKSGEQEIQESRRYRELNLNPELQRPDHITVRDTILLDLFSNRKYRAVIEKINRDINGTLVIRAKLAGYKYSYCTISTNDQKSLMILDIPETEEYYKMNYDRETNRHYLLDLDKTKIKYLEGAPSVIPPSDNRDPGRINQDDRTDSSDNSTDSSDDSGPVVSRRALNISADATAVNDENSPDLIKLLVVYTPAAAAWARTNETNIANTISLLMDRAELALSNSNTLLTLELVHSAQVSYAEVNSVDDLYNLQGTQDGFMDNVHNLRDYYAADLVVLLADVNYTGGQGFLLTSTGGQPAYGFSLTRVQQASGTYTTIHEIAHNLGCHHHKQQNTQPGPGIFPYSAGWRWNGTNNSHYCSIMTYEDGSYFSDGISHTRVPYFSNPNIQYGSGITGNASDGDNARTIRQTKTAVSSYRTEQPAVRVLSPNGGEKLLAGSTHRIRWTVSSHIANCVLAYSLNGGYTYTTIATLNSSNTSYNWTVPNTPSIQCRLRITGTDSRNTFSVSDVSDFNFEIASEIIEPCSNITAIAGCGAANVQSFTGGGSGLWFSHTGNPCGYFSPGVEKVYSFVAPETGNYSIQVTDAAGYVDYLWKTGSCSPEGWQCFAEVNSPGRYGNVTWIKGKTYYLLLDFENSFPTTHTFYIDHPESTNHVAGNTEVFDRVSTLNYRRAIPVIFSEAGTIYSLSVCHEGGRGNMLMAVYSNSSGTPGARLGVTSQTPVNSSAGWQTVSLENPVSVSAGQTVWLAWIFENSVGLRYANGAPARAQSPQSWSGGMPQNFGTASLDNYRYSVYCSYTPGETTTATLGNTDVYDLVSNLNYRRAIPVTFTESGTIESLSIC
ncbi:MAG TPA: M12 family metallo-peptidase, partial [Bacteroidales bacterium]|nr:M12 family metallo-peptidase [Bacteroidales bacterium]